MCPGALSSYSHQPGPARVFTRVTLGVGQFCTNPGLTIGLGDERFDTFVQQLEGLVCVAPAGTMLTQAIGRSYEAGAMRLSGIEGVSTTRSSTAAPESQALPSLFVTDATVFLRHHEMAEELFGPSTVVVRCGSREEVVNGVRS